MSTNRHINKLQARIRLLETQLAQYKSLHSKPAHAMDFSALEARTLALMAMPVPTREVSFQGDDALLISAIEGLLALDSVGALVPHGLGGHAKLMLSESAKRLKTYSQLTAENEKLRMQLVACGVVALANTPESAAKARDMHPDYMSASCQDVMQAVDREMALRTENKQLRESEATAKAKQEHAESVGDSLAHALEAKSAELHAERLRKPGVVEPAEKPHSDDVAVLKFQKAMRNKLALLREHGRHGWDDPSACSLEHLATELIREVTKGDPVDIANLAMMLHQRGAGHGLIREAYQNAQPVPQVWVRYDRLEGKSLKRAIARATAIRGEKPKTNGCHHNGPICPLCENTVLWWIRDTLGTYVTMPSYLVETRVLPNALVQELISFLGSGTEDSHSVDQWSRKASDLIDQLQHSAKETEHEPRDQLQPE